MSDLSQLLPISKASFSGEERLCVNMRQLHAVLGIECDYSAWIEDWITQYGLEEYVDYRVLPNSAHNFSDSSVRHDYYFLLYIAKAIIGIEEIEKGKEVRKYLTVCEKSWRSSLPNFDDPAAAAEAWAKEYRARRAAEVEKQKAQAALAQEQSVDPRALLAGVL